MEPQEPGATLDDGMDSFLEKFQSQPYRGGFHESQWEEVGGPGVSARACVGVVPAPGASRALRRSTAKVWRCQWIGGFYLRVKNRPRSFEGLLKLAVCLGVQVLESETCECRAYLRPSPYVYNSSDWSTNLLGWLAKLK